MAIGTNAFAIDKQNNLYAWGNTEFVRGDGTSSYYPMFVKRPVMTGKNFIKVTTCGNSTLALDNQGRLWGWGHNQSGELGVGHSLPIFHPTLLDGLDTYLDISMGPSFSVVLRSDGVLMGAGTNTYGNLTNLPTTNSTRTVIGTDKDWKSVYAGSRQTFAIKSDGRLFSTGYNTTGELGVGDSTNKSSFTQVGEKLWNKLSVGYAHVVGIQSDNTLWVWGDYHAGKLGNGSTVNALIPTQVMAGLTFKDCGAGTDHSFAISTAGVLYRTGSNSLGQLGNNSQAQINLWDSTGDTRVYEKVFVTNSNSTFVTDSSGKLWMAGNDEYYCLGNGGVKVNSTFINSTYKGGTPRYVSSYSNQTFIIDELGDIHVAGLDTPSSTSTANQIRRLGVDTLNSPKPLLIKKNVKKVSLYSNVVAVLLEDGTIELFGSGIGHLLLSNSSVAVTQLLPIPLHSSQKFKDVSIGLYSGLAIDADGYLWSWGNNTVGGLGDGTTISNTVLTLPKKIPSVENIKFKSVFAGTATFWAIAEDGSAYGWGNKQYGALGDSSTATSPSHTTTPQLTPVPTSAGATAWKKIQAVGQNTFALTELGDLYVTGSNSNGIFGLRHSTTTLNFTKTATNVKDIAVGSGHSVLLKNDGTVWGAGINNSGQLGRGNLLSSNVWAQNISTKTFTQIHAASNTSYTLTDTLEIIACGQNDQWQISYEGVNQSTDTPIKINGIIDPALMPDHLMIKNYTINVPGTLIMKSDASYIIKQLLPKGLVPDGTDMKFLISKDKVTWKAFKPGVDGAAGTWSDVETTNALTNGMSMAQVKALTSLDLAWIDTAFYVHVTMVTTVESATPSLAGIDLKVNVFDLPAAISTMGLTYEYNQIPEPDYNVSRDNGAHWKAVKSNQLTSLEDLPSGNELKVKTVFKEQQKIEGISYSWL